MKYTFVHIFDSTFGLSKERAIEIAQERAIKEFGKMLLENAKCETLNDGSVRITVDV